MTPAPVLLKKIWFRREESKRLGSTVYYYSAEPLTWGGAHHACRSIKGDLVRIDSVAEHNFVKQYLQEGKYDSINACTSSKAQLRTNKMKTKT